MKTEKQIQERLRLYANNDLLKEPDADLRINAPVALMQVALKASRDALKWVLDQS